MLDVIGQTLPIALALALSTVPITATMTILLSPKAAHSAGWFLAGWLIGMFATAAVFSIALYLGAHAMPAPQATAKPAVAVAEIVVGVAIGVYGVWRFRHSKPQEPRDEPSRITRIVSSIRPLPASGLALVLNVRPKSLFLMAAIGLIVGPADLPLTAGTVVLLIVTAIGSCTVAVPIIMSLARPARTRDLMQSAGDWLHGNSQTVTLVIMLVVGVFLIGNGLTRF